MKYVINGSIWEEFIKGHHIHPTLADAREAANAGAKNSENDWVIIDVIGTVASVTRPVWKPTKTRKSKKAPTAAKGKKKTEPVQPEA